MSIADMSPIANHFANLSDQMQVEVKKLQSMAMFYDRLLRGAEQSEMFAMSISVSLPDGTSTYNIFRHRDDIYAILLKDYQGQIENVKEKIETLARGIAPND